MLSFSSQQYMFLINHKKHFYTLTERVYLLKIQILNKTNIGGLYGSKRFDIRKQFFSHINDEDPKLIFEIYWKESRNAYSLWMLFESKTYCLCKGICVWNVKYSEHIVIHFIANRPRVCRAFIVKAIEVMQVRFTPYATIERTDFSTALVLGNLV